MKYFKPKETECKCGCGTNNISKELMDMMDAVREIAGFPLVINSAVRCKAHNKKVGGVDNSAHVRGYAVDIRAQTSTEKFKIVKALIAVGFVRIGVYSSFIHADIDPDKPQNILFRG